MRTLALAYRDLSEDEWESWSESHRCADKATNCREDRLAAAYEEIEQDMMVSDLVCIRVHLCMCLCVSVLLLFSYLWKIVSHTTSFPY